MNRRLLIPLIIGVSASMVGLLSIPWLRQARCLDATADAHPQWISATQACTANGASIDVSRPYDLFLGLAIGLALAFMMHRASTFAARRRVRKPR